MAVATIAHKPQLTKEQAQEIFAKQFASKYKVHEFKGLLRDFVVEKNAWVGVALKLEQTDTETKFVYAGLAPKWWARALMGALLGMFLWNGLTNEIEQFISTAPEFK
jgi:hypothetical protein